MGTINIPCTGGTFLSYVFPTADNSSMTSLPTCSEFMRNRTSDVENRKVIRSRRDNLVAHVDHWDYGGCILEFEHNALLNYKRIDSVYLHFTYKSSAINTSQQKAIYLNGSDLGNRDYYWHELVYEYFTDKNLSEINLNNFLRDGYYDWSNYEDLHNIIPTAVTSYDRTIGVPYALYNNKIRFLISAGQCIYELYKNQLYDWYMGAAEFFMSNMQQNDMYFEKYIDRNSAYLEVNYSDIPPVTPTPLSPINMGLNPNRDITFSWRYNTSTPATQASASLQYRPKNGSWTTVAVSGSSQSWTLSGGLSAGSYEWRVQTTDSQGSTSSYCAVQSFDIVAQSAPTAAYPSDGITFMENTDIAFSWIYNSLTPARQASATIKYKDKSAVNWTTYTSSSANPYCTIENIPQGNYEWKLSVTNEYGETSADSNVLEFNIIGRPQAPIILTPTNCCLTTISWNADGQEAAEIMLYQGGKLLAHETIATTVSQYKPQFFLKGDYLVKARIKNSSDLWSDFRELAFTINAAGPTAGRLNAVPLDKSVQLIGTHSSTNVALIRVEDGEETVVAMTAEAVDKHVAGDTEYIYILRSWNTGGYTDSGAVHVVCNFEGAIISDEEDELELDKSDERFFKHDETVARDYAALQFIGREYPVIERDEFSSVEIEKRFHVTREQKKILDRISKKPAVFYRDSRGNAFKAVITSVRYSGFMSHDYIAEISIMRTAPDEVIINV